MNPDWITPDWPAPEWVRAVCTTRAGGVSRAPFDSLNLGDHVGDDAGDVAANRSNFVRQLDAKPVFLKQVHQWTVTELRTGMPHDTVADACVTRRPGLACTIMVADCLPVLFTNRLGTVVAAAHAGWRGLLGQASRQGPWGVLEAVSSSFKALALADIAQAASKNIADDLLVWLGPCIGPAAFEVGDEVRSAFATLQPHSTALFRPAGAGESRGDAAGSSKWLADLPGLARQRLVALGYTRIYGNDGSLPWCTVSNPSRFFSHRRDAVTRGSSGRMAASVWIDAA